MGYDGESQACRYLSSEMGYLAMRCDDRIDDMVKLGRRRALDHFRQDPSVSMTDIDMAIELRFRPDLEWRYGKEPVNMSQGTGHAGDNGSESDGEGSSIIGTLVLLAIGAGIVIACVQAWT